MRRCEVCARPLFRRTPGQLVKVLSELHGELTMRPVPPNVPEASADSYRVGRACETIALVIAEETARFCRAHWQAFRAQDE